MSETYEACARRALCCVVLAACGGTGEAPVAVPAPQPTVPGRAPEPGPAPAPAPAENAPANRVVRGEVVDRDGRGIHGAQVALVPIGLYDPSGASYARAKTLDGGRFRLEGVPGQRYAVTATAHGHRAAKLLDVGVGVGGVRLELGSGGRTLTGRVMEGGVSRGGVEVRLLRGLGETGEIYVVETDDDGRWAAGVPVGDYLATAQHAHAAAAARPLPVGRDAADLVLVPVGAAAPPAREVVDWVRAHAIAVATVEPGRSTVDLAPVRAIVRDARVVGLGEATHGTHEIFALKHRLVEWLVSDLGFTVFAIELGLAESFAIDDYVLGGPGDPERLLAGQSAVWQTEELRDVVRWLRAWNATHPRKVRFHGLDMRTGAVAAKATLAYLARVDRAVLAAPIGRALEELADPVLYQEVVRRPRGELLALGALASELERRFTDRRAAYTARSSAAAWWRAAIQASALARLMAWLTAEDVAGRVGVREAAMANHLLRALEHHGPTARAVVWAHNAHIAGDAEAAPQMMGVHLRAQLGQAYRAFGSALHHGTYQATDPDTRALRTYAVAPPEPGSVEDVLAQAGQLAVVDLRAASSAMPVGPAMPIGPAIPVGPAMPIDPAIPVGPTMPIGPAIPVGPAMPIGPAIPVGPAMPIGPAMPVGPAANWLLGFQALRQFDGLYDPPLEVWATPRTRIARDYDAMVFVAEGSVARGLAYPRAVAMTPPREAALVNTDFEDVDAGRPRGWWWSPVREGICGYDVTLDPVRAFAGRQSARIARTPGPHAAACAAQLRQVIDAAPYRGRRVRLRAAVRLERAGEHTHLLLRAGVHRAGEMARGTAWRSHDVTIDVPGDATTLELGFAFDGDSRTWLDAVSLDALP